MARYGDLMADAKDNKFELAFKIEVAPSIRKRSRSEAILRFSQEWEGFLLDIRRDYPNFVDTFLAWWEEGQDGSTK